jgi:hypothetical protein
MPGVFRAIAGWLGDGSPLAVLAWLLFAGCNLALGLIYRRYLCRSVLTRTVRPDTILFKQASVP